MTKTSSNSGNFISDFNDVLKCLSKWSNDKKEVTKSIISEIYGIMYLFSWRELLNVKAGGIYINNELEAFIIASPLNHNTIQIIIEKANINIRGLYPAILKMFLENNFEHYEYINREEDMGLENLRKSKMSFDNNSSSSHLPYIYLSKPISPVKIKDVFSFILFPLLLFVIPL